MDRGDKTADSFFSATPEEMKLLVENVRIVEKAIGNVNYPAQKTPAKRSLIVISDVLKGDILSDKNIKSLRPGGGIEPKYSDQIINKYKASKDILKGSLLQWEMIQE